MRLRIPDWLLYGLIVLVIYFNARLTVRKEHAPSPPPPPELGPLLPLESPRDPSVLVDMGDPTSGIGTAFAIDENGTWLTARHVVDSCNQVAIHIGQGRGLTVNTSLSQKSDVAILKSTWERDPLPSDLFSTRQIGEHGYFFGFPQGRPGEVVGTLLGRHKMVIRGRYSTNEAVLAWTEVGRTRGLKGSLGGLSGGPVLDKDGEVIGIVAAESPRRGRVYTVAPRNLQSVIPENIDTEAQAIEIDSYGRQADRYRRARRIAQIMCVVN